MCVCVCVFVFVCVRMSACIYGSSKISQILPGKPALSDTQVYTYVCACVLQVCACVCVSMHLCCRYVRVFRVPAVLFPEPLPPYRIPFIFFQKNRFPINLLWKITVQMTLRNNQKALPPISFIFLLYTHAFAHITHTYYTLHTHHYTRTNVLARTRTQWHTHINTNANTHTHTHANN